MKRSPGRMSIEDLDISVRTWNGLRKAGIESIDQLLNMSVADMLVIDTLGIKSKLELFQVLVSRDRRLRGKKKVKW